MFYCFAVNPKMRHFTFQKISRESPLINDVYKLRYKVYCDEWGFEKPQDHPGGLEFDEYDAHSVHIGAFLKENGLLVGTVRIILDSELGFPIEKHCIIDADMSCVERQRIGEISRLAVSKEYRRRVFDKLLYNDDYTLEEIDFNRQIFERRKYDFLIVMGLYICMYKESVALGLTHWYAVMAKGLCNRLKCMDILFKPIGPVIDYHGLRIPYIASITDIIEKISSGKASHFEEYEKAMLNA